MQSTVTAGFDKVQSTVTDGFDKMQSTVTDGFDKMQTTVTEGFDKMHSTVTESYDQMQKKLDANRQASGFGRGLPLYNNSLRAQAVSPGRLTLLMQCCSRMREVCRTEVYF